MNFVSKDLWRTFTFAKPWQKFHATANHVCMYLSSFSIISLKKIMDLSYSCLYWVYSISRRLYRVCSLTSYTVTAWMHDTKVGTHALIVGYSIVAVWQLTYF